MGGKKLKLKNYCLTKSIWRVMVTTLCIFIVFPNIPLHAKNTSNIENIYLMDESIGESTGSNNQSSMIPPELVSVAESVYDTISLQQIEEINKLCLW